MLTAKEMRENSPKYKKEYELFYYEVNMSAITSAVYEQARKLKTTVEYQMSELNPTITKMVVDELERLGYTVLVEYEMCLTISWGE